LKSATQSARGEALTLKFDSSLMLQIMAKNRYLSEAVAAHVLERLDKEKERRRNGSKLSGGGANGSQSKKDNSIGNRLWRKIRNSVVINVKKNIKKEKKNIKKDDVEKKKSQKDTGLRKRR
tara:strand:- start:150 stop:512 length:363 start_codon:yes stop_codon:yes gene_type:complete